MWYLPPVKPIPLLAFLSLAGLIFGAFPAEAQTSGAKRTRTLLLESDPTGLTTGTRRLVTREESEGRTYEKWSVEAPSVNGGTEVVLEVEEETVQVDSDSQRTVRRVLGRDPDGKPRLIRTVEEERTRKADGGEHAVRSFSERDLNGGSQVVRREIEETAAQGQGVFRTGTDVLLADPNRSGLVPSERIERTERRQDDQVLESDQTRYRPTERGAWQAFERHIANNRFEGGEVQRDEQIFRLDEAERLSLSERSISREWKTPAGEEHRTVEIFSTDVPGQARSKNLQLLRRISQVKREKPGGSAETVIEVEQMQVDRMRVVEKVIERTRPDGRGGFVTEREVLQLDADGRLMRVNRPTSVPFDMRPPR